MAAPQMQRSIEAILEDIASNLTQMVRAEIRLAKIELKEGVEKSAGPVAALGAGVTLGIFGLGFLLLATVFALSLVMAGWLATLLVGGVLTVAAGILIGAGGTKLKRVNLTPDKTIRTLEEDVQWARQQIK
jgi:uncharacterized membrane protein YqjE